MNRKDIKKHIHAVIMAGGGGERFWPRSRQAYPKQLLRIFGKKTMLQETARRVAPFISRDRLFVITSRAQAAEARRQLPGIPRSSVIAEPFGRDTAACVALGAAVLMERDPNAIMVLLPADHVIKNRRKFVINLEDACRMAWEHDCLVTFGIIPSGPCTGYGYIKRGDWIKQGLRTVFARVERFTEKPGRSTASRYVRCGNYFWNSGIFVWKASVIAGEFKKRMPELYRAYLEIRKALKKPGWEKALAKIYGGLEKISIDYGIMEKAKRVMMARADFDWDDAGSWLAMERHFPADASGNIAIGDNVALDSKRCIIHSDGGVVGCLGLEDIIVIRTPDAVLVCHRDSAQDIKKLVRKLKAKKNWGMYT